MVTVWPNEKSPGCKHPKAPRCFALRIFPILLSTAEQFRRMGQTYKHKTAINFLSKCDKTEEKYEIADYEFGWLLTIMTVQNSMCRNLTTSRSEISMVMLSGTRFVFVQYTPSVSRNHLLLSSPPTDCKEAQIHTTAECKSITSYRAPWHSKSNRDTIVVEVNRHLYLTVRLDRNIYPPLFVTVKPTDKIRIYIFPLRWR